MTKRFRVMSSYLGMYKIFDEKQGMPLNSREVVEVLNTLIKEKEQLKIQLGNCLNKKLFSRRELERENKELKQRISEAKSMEFQILYRDIENLKREKEELKQQLEDAKFDVEKYEHILKDIMSDNLLIQDSKGDC